MGSRIRELGSPMDVLAGAVWAAAKELRWLHQLEAAAQLKIKFPD